MSTFKRGTNFPNEGFIQKSIETYFKEYGYTLLNVDLVDLACQKCSEKWFIEAKGHTQGIGVDFNTGLGQILKHMSDPACKYGIAVPKTDKFLFQINKVPKRVCSILNLHWILVDEDGHLEFITPE